MEKWKSNYVMNQLEKFGSMKKRFEMAIILSVITNDSNLEIRPALQFFVRRKPSEKIAYIDMYYPDIKLAIEIDEEYHDSRQDEDAERQQEIINALGCTFFRINAKKDSFNIGESISQINNEIDTRIKEQKNNGAFTKWTEPPTKTLRDLQSETQATIIIKTIVKDGTEVLPFNQISSEIKSLAKNVIAYSGSTEYHSDLVGFTAFSIDSYIQDPQRSTFISPTGATIADSPYLNTYIDKWDGHKSIVYSNDLLETLRSKGKHNKKKGKK